MIVESYHPQEAYKRSQWILAIMSLFFILVFSVGVGSLYRLHLGSVWFWVLFVLMLLPLVINQALLLVACIVFLLCFSSQQQWKQSSSFWIVVTVWAVLYALSCYIMMTMILYFYGTTTIVDLQNYNHMYRDFIDLKNIPIAVENQEEFLQQVEKGKSNIAQRTVVFGCLARDVEDNFERMHQRLETMGSFFKEYAIVVYENDSKDGTRSLLEEWSRRNPRVVLLDCCTEGNCDCREDPNNLYSYGYRSNTRIDKMRNFRQKVLRHAQVNYSHYDYYIVVDFDIPGSFYLDGFFSSFHRNDFDMVCARGLTSWVFSGPVMYDPLAYISEGQSFDYTDTHFKEVKQLHKLDDVKIGAPWIPCRSGFNGLAIYKMSSILDCSYTKNAKKLKCEHIDLHYDMHQKKFQKIYFNPSMVLFVGHQGPERHIVFHKILRGQSF